MKMKIEDIVVTSRVGNKSVTYDKKQIAIQIAAVKTLDKFLKKLLNETNQTR